MVQFLPNVKCRVRHTFDTRIGRITRQPNRRARHTKTDLNLMANWFEIEGPAQDVRDIAVVLVFRVVSYRLAQQAAADADANAVALGVNHALF